MVFVDGVFDGKNYRLPLADFKMLWSIQSPQTHFVILGFKLSNLAGFAQPPTQCMIGEGLASSYGLVRNIALFETLPRGHITSDDSGLFIRLL